MRVHEEAEPDGQRRLVGLVTQACFSNSARHREMLAFTSGSTAMLSSRTMGAPTLARLSNFPSLSNSRSSLPRTRPWLAE
jgi:hypothetical protein